jgi:hypothetical protein
MAQRGSPEWRENIRRAKSRDPSMGYAAIHFAIRKLRTGMCSHCGKEGWTDMAYKHHPLPYTRSPDDFHELCRSCHKTLYPPSAETRQQISTTMKRVRAERFWSSRPQE